MIVTLDVPDHVSYQLVYRLQRSQPYVVALEDELQFVFVGSLGAGLCQLRRMVDCCGRLGAIKALAKAASGTRSLYMIAKGRHVLTAGWCTRGSCRYYNIEPQAVVVGPIWTVSKEQRSKGLATRALQLAINELISRGLGLYYIDTEKTNIPAQKVFQKCGFGTPVALYFREPVKAGPPPANTSQVA